MTHYLHVDDKQDFDVLNEGPLSGISKPLVISDEGLSLETYSRNLVYRLQ